MHGDKLLDDHRARRRARQDVLLHFRALSSWQDQHKVFKVIQGYFIPNHESVPRPAGRVSKPPYWLRAEVEAWSDEHDAT